MPRYSLVIDDLAHRSDADLHQRSLPPLQKLALWLLRDARDPERLLASFDTSASTMLTLFEDPFGTDALPSSFATCLASSTR